MSRGTPRFYYKQDRLKQLRAFCHTVQTGTVSAAAGRMHLSQSSVSLLIRALETELDVRLFERRGPRIRPTAEGRALAEIAQPLVEGIDAVPDVLAERCRNDVLGELSIAAGESSILYILPSVIRQFQALYPQVRFNVRNVIAPHGLSLVQSGEVDFGVGSMLEVPDDVEYRPLYNCGTRLITPLGHPLNELERLSLEDVSPYGLVLPPPPQHAWRHVDLAFRRHGLAYDVKLEAGGWEVIKQFVAAGLGISIVSSVCLRGDEELVSRPLDEYFPERSYGLVLRRGKRLSPAALRFLELIDAARPEGSVRAGLRAHAAGAGTQ